MTFRQHLRGLLDDIFEAAFDEDICGFNSENDLADAAGVCWGTVHNLYSRQTKEPRHSTIWKLCKAVKMDIELAREQLGLPAKRKSRKAA